jgi:glucokinase
LLPYKDHTLEYYASGNFFSVFHNITAAEAHERALNNDAQALAAWKEFGGHFGQAIKNVVLTYDPEAIVLGGSVSKAYRFFSLSMFSSLNSFPFPESIKRLKIFQSQNENISLLGAAAMVHKLTGELSRVKI